MIVIFGVEDMGVVHLESRLEVSAGRASLDSVNSDVKNVIQVH